MSAPTTLAPPAQIQPSAAAELRALPRDILTIRPVVSTLVQVRTDPSHVGAPIGPSEDVYMARCGQTGYVVIYTIGAENGVTIHGLRKVIGV